MKVFYMVLFEQLLIPSFRGKMIFFKIVAFYTIAENTEALIPIYQIHI